MTQAVELAVAATATIGESPTWSAVEAALYWIDVKAPALHRLDTRSGATRSWPLGADIGAFALRGDGRRALLAQRDGLHALEFATGATTHLLPPPYDPALFRFNEGACDSEGRFWIGVMFDPLDGDMSHPLAASLHRYTDADGLVAVDDATELHNGMAWSRTERSFYLSHSKTGVIHAFDYDIVAGRLSRRREFARIPPWDGIPDGAAVDVDGGYWCALHGGWRLRRFHSDGTFDQDVALPVSQPTMCAFGGEALDTLYVTSATDKLTPAQRALEPLAGSVLRFRPPYPGIRRYVIAD